MASVKFNLRSGSNDKDQPIYLVFRHQRLRVVYATGAKVRPKYWSADKQRVKNVTHVPAKDKINNLLNDLETEISRYAVELLEQRDAITADAIRLHLDEYTGKRQTDGKTLLTFIKGFIEQSKTRILPETGKPVHHRTILKYQTTEKALNEFAGVWRRRLDFDTVDLDFYNDFVSWLQKNGYSLNYIGKHIQVIKTFLHEATNRGINSNQAFQQRAFKVLKEESDNIYLSEKELETLHRLELADNIRLDRVRDLFIVGAWTGLRFSDFTAIRPENVQGDLIQIEQYKTGGRVAIPIHPTVRAILEKYKGRLPSAISNQKMNDYLKEVCKLAGIDQAVSKGITRGGARIVKRFEKWELVSTHTARRSFATNLYKSGFPSISIMKITGHTTEKAFLKYIKVTPEENAKMLQLHWEKSGHNLKVI